MQETAYAKINLALHVRAREPDGYHRIETLFAFCEDGDVLAVGPADELALAVTGPFAADLAAEKDNLVLQAARALASHAGVVTGAALSLEKRLPVASGIGGGSADAAAALRLLARFWSLDIDHAALHAIAASLGADVPACLDSRPARGEGRGDQLAPLADDSLSGQPILLVNPHVPLSTARVFRAWDGIDRGPLVDWRTGRNDLEAPARQLAPEIGEVLQSLEGVGLARMSGSGATCFVLLPADAQGEIVRRIRSTHPDWWCLETRLR